MNVTADDIEFLAKWDPKAEPCREIAYMPARVLMQDFTGVPAIVDLAAMRDAMKTLGGDPEKSIPCSPPNWSSTTPCKWTSTARSTPTMPTRCSSSSATVSATPSSSGDSRPSAISPLCRRAWASATRSTLNISRASSLPPRLTASCRAYPDTLVGTDSHTTMINGLGVLGWGVGGIEAEAAMLGQPVSMLVPQVVGFKLTGKLKEGATATDLVLTVTQMLRKLGVVGKFVEFYGAGISELPLADRATISNMAPEYGATCGIFPVDAETLRYLRLTGRSEEQIALVEAYYKEQGLFHTAQSPEAEYIADSRTRPCHS